MNTLHLKYAVEIERTGSISQAAANLYMGQPNLSKAMRELEASLGITIFERSNKGVRPTAKGREFLSYAKKVLAQVEEIEALCKREDQQESFRLAAPPASYISYAFTRFLRQLGTGQLKEVDFRESDSDRTIKSVREGVSLMGIVRFNTRERAAMEQILEENCLVTSDIWEFKPLLIFSSHHPLATRMVLTQDDLTEYTLIHNDDLVVTDELLPSQPTALAEQTSLNINDRHSQLHFLSTMLNSYTWTSPLPATVLADYDLVERPCDSVKGRYADVLVHSSTYRMSEADYLFLAELNRIRKEISSSGFY